MAEPAPKRRISGGATVLAAGTAGSQLVMLLVAPILTRIYSPADFGVLQLFTVALSLLLVLATLRTELSIPVIEDADEARHVVWLAISLSVLVGAIAALGVIVAAELNPGSTVGKLAEWGALLGLATTLGGVFSALSLWNLRTTRYHALGKARVMQSIEGGLTQVGLGFAGFHPAGLLVVATVVQGGGTWTLARGFLVDTRPLPKTPWHPIRLLQSLKRYPLFEVPSALLSAASIHVPSLILAWAFGPATLGEFALAMRVLSLPVALVGESVSKVYLANGRTALLEGRIAERFESTIDTLTGISIPVFALIATAAPWVFPLFFGSEWKATGLYAALLAPALGVQLIVAPIGTTTILMRRQGVGTVLQATLFVLSCAAIGLGFLTRSVANGLIALSVVTVLTYAVFLVWAARISGARVRPILKDVIVQSVLVSAFLSPAWIGSHLGATGLVRAGLLLPASLYTAWKLASTVEMPWAHKPYTDA